MSARARLDQVLEQLGYATTDDIRRGLARQRTEGGRLGANLVALGLLSEVQLVEALAVQFDLPWTATVARDLDAALVRRLPPELVRERTVVPLDLARGTLTVLAADPLDGEAFERARIETGARTVLVMLAPSAEIRARVSERCPELADGPRTAPRVVLPELFAPEDRASAGGPAAEEGGRADRTRVLLVAEGAAYRNFLPTILHREGCDLVVASSVTAVDEALARGAFDRVLVSRDLWEDFSSWVRRGRVGDPGGAEVSPFPGVADALLENPAPYETVVRSLRTAVEALADGRGRGDPGVPYGLMAHDMGALARRYGLRRLARDGLHLALHLLVPGAADGEQEGPFADLPGSLSLAASLRFPFPLDAVLGVCHALFRGRADPGETGPWGEEVHLGAQMLALVWIRYAGASGTNDPAALRAAAAEIVRPELLEVYLRLLSERGDAASEGYASDVLLVGSEGAAPALATRLRRLGCRALQARDPDDASEVIRRRSPAAVVVDEAAVRGDVLAFCRSASSEGGPLVYVLATTAGAAGTLALLDAGADDVFTPPIDLDLVSARVHRGIRDRARIGARGGDAGRFAASFDMLSFLDLVQTLSHARKSVRVEIRRREGDQAVVHLHGGRIVHAVCGDLLGEAAVHRVIAWEDDGAFEVVPESDPPAPTIHVATDAVLMEGCRLLDESTV